MNTNNRNVRVKQHAVLLTVLEHAEDLIKKTKRGLNVPQTVPVGSQNE